ncbi:hypothetical protein ACOMHN_018651 [Nucella lapillus]
MAEDEDGVRGGQRVGRGDKPAPCTARLSVWALDPLWQTRRRRCPINFLLPLSLNFLPGWLSVWLSVCLSVIQGRPVNSDIPASPANYDVSAEYEIPANPNITVNSKIHASPANYKTPAKSNIHASPGGGLITRGCPLMAEDEDGVRGGNGLSKLSIDSFTTGPVGLVAAAL